MLPSTGKHLEGGTTQFCQCGIHLLAKEAVHILDEELDVLEGVESNL